MALELLPADSVTHKTHWRLEKRNGDANLAVASLFPEADAILQGKRPWSGDLDARQVQERAETIRAWLNDPKTDLDIRRTYRRPGRLAKAIAHDLWIAGTPLLEPATERDGNILVTAGIALFLALMTGGGGTVYSNANSNLGVGDSSTAAAVGQTDLQASSNKLRKAMNATYPTIAAPAINFQSTFGSSDANYVWNEVATFNAPSAGTMLNRVVQALGTKSGGSTWTLTETITWS